MAELDSSKYFSGLLNGITQNTYYNNPEMTEELLKNELYPDISLCLRRGVLKSIASADMNFNQLEAFLIAQTKKQGGVSAEQTAVLSKFWKNHKSKIQESLISQSRCWDNSLRNVSWRVDLKTQSRHADQVNASVMWWNWSLGRLESSHFASGVVCGSSKDLKVMYEFGVVLGGTRFETFCKRAEYVMCL
ncbi:COMM domain-containing protein 1-like isoform X2 [Acipenser ruthenus]|uniref:COMM domain-containing protein 1-like isoform X2 n=1 Tax=Acipenser ruthenus TaxID=7906 RepID=UPI00274278F8|nr:COMM domain-containing protein 1-like isoform X2 [Acipenser ruthenus]